MQNLDAGIQKIIEIGAENNVSFTVEEVKSFLLELEEEDEFDDVELNQVALAAVRYIMVDQINNKLCAKTCI